MISRNQRQRAALKFGDEIVKRRKLLKMSQVELAGKLGMTNVQLCKIERGCNLPTKKVALRLERALGLNDGSLVELRNQLLESYAVPVSVAAVRSVSRLEVVTPGVSASDEGIAALLEEIVPRIDGIVAREDDIGLPHFCHLHLGDFKTTTDRDGTALARAVRSRLDIGGTSLRNAIPLLEQFNVRILPVPTLPPIRPPDEPERIRPTLSFHDTRYNCPVICVNEAAIPESQLYHVAYELGWHFKRQRAVRKRLPANDARRSFARAFAAELLMPASAVRDLIDTLRIEDDDWTLDLMSEVARRFDVSATALLFRMRGLRHISEPSFEQLYRQFKDLATFDDATLFPKPPPLPFGVWLKTLERRVNAK